DPEKISWLSLFRAFMLHNSGNGPRRASSSLTGVCMRICTVLLIAVISLGSSGCSREETDEAARKAGKTAHDIADKTKKAAKEASKDIKEAAHEAREGWKEGGHKE